MKSCLQANMKPEAMHFVLPDTGHMRYIEKKMWSIKECMFGLYVHNVVFLE